MTDARGFGRQRGHTEVYRGAEYPVDSCPRPGSRSWPTTTRSRGVVKAIVDGARTGSIGDGKVWV